VDKVKEIAKFMSEVVVSMPCDPTLTVGTPVSNRESQNQKFSPPANRTGVGQQSGWCV